MAQHNVKFSVPERELGNADIEFYIKKNNQKFGTLKISKGALVWVPRDHTYGHKVGWAKFDEWISENGKKES